ncbi:ribosome-binding factor A [Povalibacter uvarum]|uniref:Ribosome-binding factor A n=1 Tax=Povalibacter uvarum TaxID=732238 RepID=A0A841HHX1_9GAMM|nr:30S ribosome-binding factor RbfA [Povalibacter uvarum]MBB6091910.1 ribosome-binding factor A [Povalibacter uvarum]
MPKRSKSSSKAFPRHRRVAQQIQRALSDLIRREIRDPRLGMLTLTEVRVSSDLSYATVYYSVLNANREEAHEVLIAAADILRGPLGRALGLRHAPELRFVADELIESGAHLSALISKAVNDDVARHVDEPEADEADEAGDTDDDEQDDSEESDRR